MPCASHRAQIGSSSGNKFVSVILCRMLEFKSLMKPHAFFATAGSGMAWMLLRDISQTARSPDTYRASSTSGLSSLMASTPMVCMQLYGPWGSASCAS